MVPEIQEMILARKSANEIRNKADALGMTSLAQDGWEKVLAGVTTPEELLRVTT
jgi:type II secretory ATPase GspE/PulE/Tfp pilus assembly ATPase PilB-like protein